MSGSKLRKWIVPKSAKVFDFQRAFKLSQEEVNSHPRNTIL